MEIKANPMAKISLDDLPEELWIDIIKQSSINHSNSVPYIPVDRLLMLTLVSRDWQDRIQSTPLFWTDLVVDEDMQDLATKLHLCAYLSKNSLLAVHFVSLEPWREVANLILPLKSRIRTISVRRLPLTLDPSLEASFCQILKEISPLPQISSIILDRGNLNSLEIRQFVSNHPSLVDIIGISLDLSILLCDSRKWRRFSTNETPEEVIHHFHDLKSLQNITFTSLHEPTGKDTPRPWSLACDSLSMIRITTFTVNLLIQMALSITFLEVHSSVGALRNALPVFKRMELLDTLSIHLSQKLTWIPVEPISALDDTLPNQKRKRRLTQLSIKHYARIIMNQGGYRDEIVSLCRDFHRMMPSILELRLHLWQVEDAALFVDNGFLDVESISIDCISHTPATKEDYCQGALWDLPRSLQSLSIRCSGSNLNCSTQKVSSA
jgi:hypothetical protein